MIKRIAAGTAVIIAAGILLVYSVRALPQAVNKEEPVKTVIFEHLK